MPLEEQKVEEPKVEGPKLPATKGEFPQLHLVGKLA